MNLKLEKNRESARKARQRKNLYIRLLENQVKYLKKQAAQSQIMEKCSIKYLSNIKSFDKPVSKPSMSSTVQDDLDRYISQENLLSLNQDKIRDETKIKRLQLVVSEYQNWFSPELLKNFINLKSKQNHTLESQRSELNHKIMQAANLQYSQRIKNSNDNDLWLLVPFEEKQPSTKIANIIKRLGKGTEEMQVYLNKLSQLTQKACSLISTQEQNELQIPEVTRNRMRTIITQQKLCTIGDYPDKMIQRSLRWDQYPTICIANIMHQVLELDSYVEKNNEEFCGVDENEISEEYANKVDRNSNQEIAK